MVSAQPGAPPGNGAERVSIMARKASKSVSKSVSKVSPKADTTAVILDALKGLNAAQLAAVLSAISPKADNPAPATPVSPVKKPRGDGSSIVVKPVAAVAASKPAIALPTPVNNPLGIGAIENVPVICYGISPIIFNRRPTQIVNLVHKNGTPFVVYLHPKQVHEQEIKTGGQYLLSGILMGTDETPDVCRQSKPYQGVGANMVKEPHIEKA